MFQQIIAAIVILFFVFKLIWQKKKGQVARNEFIFWIVFWIIGLAAILSLKQIDNLVAKMGFSGSGINILFYIAVIIIFHLIIKLRIRMEKQEKNITKIIREIAINNPNSENKEN